MAERPNNGDPRLFAYNLGRSGHSAMESKELIEKAYSAEDVLTQATIGNAWRLHWDNAPVHTSRVVKAFLEEKAIQVVPHPPYSPGLAPADYFLFSTIKGELGGVSISSVTVKVEWDRACSRLLLGAFASAFDKWIERLKKCVEMKGNYVEKGSKIAEDEWLN